MIYSFQEWNQVTRSSEQWVLEKTVLEQMMSPPACHGVLMAMQKHGHSGKPSFCETKCAPTSQTPSKKALMPGFKTEVTALLFTATRGNEGVAKAPCLSTMVMGK